MKDRSGLIIGVGINIGLVLIAMLAFWALKLAGERDSLKADLSQAIQRANACELKALEPASK